MQHPLFAAKGCILDAVLILEAFFMVDMGWEFSLPLNGAPLPASPFLAGVAERASRPICLSSSPHHSQRFRFSILVRKSFKRCSNSEVVIAIGTRPWSSKVAISLALIPRKIL
jgi:hypothetical protein